MGSEGASKRPFLRAEWREVALVNFSVDPQRLLPHMPSGIEVDVHAGRAFVTLASLDFHHTRVLGIAWPGLTSFPEVNLRTYGRRAEERGVVFLRELVPSRLVAWVARRAFREPFAAARIESRVHRDGTRVLVDRRFEQGGRWHRLALHAQVVEREPSALESFLVERQLGFARARDGTTRAFRLERPPWKLHPVESFELEIDWRAAFGAEWADLESAAADPIVLASGSAAAVHLPER